jgi:Kdo2-lipid IVA lauroyltransferase/acyltransferase
MIFASLRLAHVLLFRFVGFALFLIMKNRRRITKANIKACRNHIYNKSIDNQSATFWAMKSFCSMGQTLADLLILNFYTKKNIDKFVSCKNLETIQQATSVGNGVIITSSHFGSWELAGHFLALKGYKSLVIYNKFRHSRFIEKFVKKQREFSGNILVVKNNSMIKTFKHLKRGGIVLILTDQHADASEGTQSTLLGHKVSCHSGFIRLAAKTHSAIIPAAVLNLGFSAYDFFKWPLLKNSPFRCSIEIGKPIWPRQINSNQVEAHQFSEDKIIKQTLNKTNSFLEQMISRAPEQWMWQHRRFKKTINYSNKP